MTDETAEQRLARQWRKLEREKVKDDLATIQGRRDEAALALVNTPQLADRTEWIEARALYMRYVPMTRISQECGIELDELKLAIYAPHVGWKRVRSDIMEEVNESIKTTHLAVLQKTLGVSLRLICRSLEHVEKTLADEKREPTLYEAEMIAKIFSRLHKAKVIENISDRDTLKLGMSPMEVMRELGKDPYLKRAIQMNGDPDKSDEMLEQEEESVTVVKNADSGSLADPSR